MSNDPILDEVREAKRKHAECFGFDVRAICADVMASQQIRENCCYRLHQHLTLRLTRRCSGRASRATE